jgi:multidrug efflux system outer membrane protein
MKTMKSLLLAPAVALLVGCADGPPIDTAALPATPAAFKERDPHWTLASPAEAQPRGTWWKAFSDPVLDDLVARADQANTSIAVAAARLVQARALLKSADAERLPQLGLGASALRGDGLSVTNLPAGSPRTLYTAAATASYEVDLFGRLAQASRAAQLDAHAAEALLRSTKLLAEADVAQAYLGLRALDDERALVRRTVAAFRATLDLTERRYRAGDVAELDVTRAQTEVAATESEALALDRQRAELEHAISVLVGEPASTFSIREADWTTALPEIPAGVPATVLTRRPDVSAAQDQMLAAQARAGVAKAAWFPSISLTALGGRASTDLSNLFAWPARAWAIGAFITQPLFDGGRRQADIELAGGEMDVAVARYREQVLVAFRDVEDQLAALRLLAEQSDAQARAVASATRTTALSDTRYRNGFVSQLELLDAQRSELRNRRQAVEVRSARYQATVGLVRALGGGWVVGS